MHPLVPLAAPFALAGGALLSYLFYLGGAYHRIEDCKPLAISHNFGPPVPCGKELTTVSFNLGFGAYSPDFSFFLSGGKDSVAKSKKAVLENTAGSLALLRGLSPDFLLAQEVDIDSTRSYHVNQYALLTGAFPEYAATFAVNYDSPFLAWPPRRPHGKSLAGLATLSRFSFSSAVRYSLPVSTGPTKFLDLDRCYVSNCLPTQNERNLYLYHVHLSAYGGTPKLLDAQIDRLFSDMHARRQAGHYVVCGGDFNQSLVPMPRETGARPFPFGRLPAGIRFAGGQNAPAIPTVRDSAKPYQPESSRVSVIDGFFVSDNVIVTQSQNIDAGFLYSDHNPVVMRFILSAD